MRSNLAAVKDIDSNENKTIALKSSNRENHYGAFQVSGPNYITIYRYISAQIAARAGAVVVPVVPAEDSV